MDISVIVVTYNQESTIRRTLDSILSQITEADYEIVIGDDCSSDGTLRICQEYAERYPDKIVYLRRDRNMGVVGNYFDCMARCRGRFLADCAGDDYWTDERKLQKQFEIMAANPEVSAVFTDWLSVNSETGELSRQKDACQWAAPKTFAEGELLADIFSHKIWLHLCTALYRKDIITEEVKKAPEVFTDPDFSCEDFQILLALAKGGKIVWSPDVTLHYSIGHDSVSHKKTFARMLDYSVRTMRQSLVLQEYFLGTGLPDDVVSFNVKNRNYITALTFHAGPDNTGVDVPKELLKGKGIKNVLYRVAMYNKTLWRMSLALRNLV